ncbi:NAD(P)-dependent dehydrogenase, short-chain alcohol dehydrogenase family [Roseivivax lentus]|uniref:NAD(P)-dependent dehydrogenase, short-chain alcohol dehydrogenase family n=1 Tax=Roseivivax lentus TaxID=633194 RepID=A0A1N7NML0_9RHOB|nr:SDR family NAD(P)-dependent oxidoreductase [Roseivivax lentus]SIS99500.1 NAD(P)-dependent dehydrogenase, short-chain alcohol dehydrogenase family [Roseivivax lentus]
MHLAGKHALVTGGGTGIGLAIAHALADAGAHVTITGRRAAVLEEAEGLRLSGQVMDVADEASVRDGIAAAVASRGPVQICVANAGIAEGRALPKTDLAFWRQMMAINLDGCFLTIREALDSMRQTDWGRVIAVSSVAGLRGLKGAPTYTASKHGMIGLIRALAADYAGKPYTFNALCPAYVDTDIVSSNVTKIMERTGMSEADATAAMVGVNAHGRLIRPEEVAEAALFLCGPNSGSVNGQAIQIAGGEV